MRLAPLLLAAPAVLQVASAQYAIGRQPALERWQFARQDTTAAAGGGGSAAATSAAATSEAAAADPTTTSTTAAAAPTTTSRAVVATTTSSTSTTEAAQPSRTTAAADTSSSTPAQATSTQAVQTSNTAQATPNASSTTNQQQQPSPQTPQQSSTTEFVVTALPTTSAVITTDQSGKTLSSVIYVTVSASVAVSATSTASAESKGVSQSTIIGLAVTGSIAGLIVIVLIVWKLTNKRFADLEDTGDDDAIKWPELHKDSAAMTPIPARPSARATETNTLDDFDRQSAAAHSTADLQYPPYSDDPGYGTRPAYYDPYTGAAGAVKPYASPPGSHDGDHKNWGGPGDAQYYDAPRGPSPAPNQAYGSMIGRGASPGPNMAYVDPMGRASPAPPTMAYADPMARTGSPGPGAYGYGGGYPDAPMAADPYGGRHSPGPNLAYGANQNDMGMTDPYGRRSPGPGLAYSGAVGRVGSPGPNAQGGYR